MKINLQVKIDQQQADLLKKLSWTIDRLQNAKKEIEIGNKARGINDIMTTDLMSLIKSVSTLQATQELQEDILNSDWLSGEQIE